jgi:hypothetical protein
MPPALHRAMLAFRASMVPKPSKSAILMSALEEFLTKRGFYDPTQAVDD